MDWLWNADPLIVKCVFTGLITFNHDRFNNLLDNVSDYFSSSFNTVTSFQNAKGATYRVVPFLAALC